MLGVVLTNLQSRLSEVTEDYTSVVYKFDECRACIASAVYRLGGDPNLTKDAEPWHETLIKQLDSLLPSEKE